MIWQNPIKCFSHDAEYVRDGSCKGRHVGQVFGQDKASFSFYFEIKMVSKWCNCCFVDDIIVIILIA